MIGASDVWRSRRRCFCAERQRKVASGAHLAQKRGAGSAAFAGEAGLQDTSAANLQDGARCACKLRTVRAPFFPRYLFIILDLGRDRWLSVRVRSVSQTCSHVRQAGPGSRWGGGKPQQQIRKLSGPFADLLGTLHGLDYYGRYPTS